MSHQQVRKDLNLDNPVQAEVYLHACQADRAEFQIFDLSLDTYHQSLLFFYS